jgi:hypothetical protein
MRKHFFPIVSIVSVALLCTAGADAGEGSPEQCRRLEERIERYTELRRSGGTAAQMASWRRSRSEAEAAYRTYNCHRQGRKMIRITPAK